ncbi:MAG: hypothetical protein IKN42_00910, partial [Elusimicrobia bacterium]|nr:hypothetical protein [Elusimicrobiota bacterium]
KFYDTVFESEKEKNNDDDIIVNIIKKHNIKRRKKDIVSLYYKINNALLTEQKNIFKKYFQNFSNNDIIRYTFNNYNKYIKEYTATCLNNIMNDIKNLNNKEMSQFSSQTIKQIYRRNNLLDRNNEAIEEFSKYITEEIKSLKENLKESL